MCIHKELALAEPFLTAFGKLPDFESSEMREIVHGWFRACRGDSIPKLADFDLTNFPKLLPSLILMESFDGAPQTFRYVGRRVVESAGREVTGLTYAELVGEAVAEAAFAKFNIVTAHPCGRSVRLMTRRSSGIVSAVKVLNLPLVTGRSGHRCILSMGVESEEWVSVDVDIAEDFLAHEQDQFFDIGFGVPDDN